MKNSRIFRGICYLLIPILIAGIIISLGYVFVINTEYSSEKNFFSSTSFEYIYLNDLCEAMQELIFAKQGYETRQDGDMTIYYSRQKHGDFLDNFLIIYQNKVLTNIKLDTVEEIKNYILENKPYYLCYENNTYNTNAEVFKASDCIEDYYYNRNFTYYTNIVTQEYTEVVDSDDIVQTTPLTAEEAEEISFDTVREYHTAKIKDFKYYTSYDEKLEENGDIKFIIEMVKILEPYDKFFAINIPVSSILILIMAVYLINSIGHIKGKDEIVLTDFDKFPIEIYALLFLLVVGISGAILEEFSYSMWEYSKEVIISVALTMYIVNMTLLEMLLITLIVRIKAKKFGDTCICGKLIKWCWKVFILVFKKCLNLAKICIQKIKKWYKSIIENINIVVKFVAIICGWLAISVLLVAAFEETGAFFDLLLIIFMVIQAIKRIISYQKLEQSLKEIYEGGKVTLYQSDFSTEFAKSVEYVNDISNGFENAVEESLKSERLKTELITNVSHDIKTPLTSIINYVDLIKKEDIDNEKVKEYIEILDDKSQRLKKLTEDLVEASKASSGNVSLNLEPIGVGELLNQAIGEYKDKFEAKKLEIITNLSKENIKINADSRYLYRVIDNLFGNISKYALESSRVYIETKKIDDKVIISLKNISKDRLNISEEELMQRFVRGDKSRTTEGSGLGLAIARSLTELQKGNLNCKIDGDLFKVELEFNVI